MAKINSSDLKVTPRLCPCGKTKRTALERVPRGPIMKKYFYWLPFKKYKCYKCLKVRWIMG